MPSEIAELQKIIQTFCEERDWDQFHKPKDLAIGLSTESAELLEIFRFHSDAESEALLSDPETRVKVEDELADTLFFILRFAQRYNIDLPTALRAKITKTALKYPVEKSRGSNRKYDQF